MKKALIYLSIVFVSGALSYSCKTKEHCPAYGKMEGIKARTI
jgi:hypothetical protein